MRLRGAEWPATLGLSAQSFLPRLPDTLDDVVDWVWDVLQGDFAADPSTSQVVAGAVLTMVPGGHEADRFPLKLAGELPPHPYLCHRAPPPCT